MERRVGVRKRRPIRTSRRWSQGQKLEGLDSRYWDDMVIAGQAGSRSGDRSGRGRGRVDSDEVRDRISCEEDTF